MIRQTLEQGGALIVPGAGNSDSSVFVQQSKADIKCGRGSVVISLNPDLRCTREEHAGHPASQVTGGQGAVTAGKVTRASSIGSHFRACVCKCSFVCVREREELNNYY